MLPVLTRELAEGSPSSRLALEAGRALLSAGYHQQVPVRSGFLNLFAIVDGQRRALAARSDIIEVRGTRERWPLAEALERLEREPRAWSPGALLRPLVQDALLPTAAYVAGPAEIAYHAQIGSAYAHFGVPRPVAVAATQPDAGRAGAGARARGRAADARRPGRAIPSAWSRAGRARTTPTSRRPSPKRARRSSASWAPSRRCSARTTRRCGRPRRPRADGRSTRSGGLHEKALRALKKRDQGRADRLRRTRDVLLPGGSLQERGLGLIGLVGRHGRAILPMLEERLQPFARGTRWSGYEARDRLLSDLGRLRRRGGRARQAARAPRPRGPRHLVSAAVPARRASSRTSASTRSTSRPTRCSSTRRTSWRSR